ncbi:hypothetical protein GAP32_146 [Cronobacter phage vB_CsaM_GAP32]|uniref:Uncharacterized protein n=1 Tax=Cronobacter phage vB_CsaM_GAP32 TaxID=1141136 RepID=K4F5U7_9CAUD|nr:hypothetical protein GAP32_146 [Cronobacter phage vB_CsaM_GAP32]AFC21596.1 hypothetical protein GAP32_146 [Cronobacter phage vB_CsaM_GAP32]
MGFQPKPNKNDKNTVNMLYVSDAAEEQAREIGCHKHILLLRKSAGKLRQYVDCFVNTKFPTQRLIEIKYEFSKCRPEVLAMMESMAKDPRRFNFESLDTHRKVFVDTLHGTRFQYYDFSSNPNIVIPTLYINGREFLSKIELQCISSVINSLSVMHENEYKLQEELKALEEQENVFKIYHNEKHSTNEGN